MSVKQQFIDYVKKMQNYGEALGVIYWDMRTGAPKKGITISVLKLLVHYLRNYLLYKLLMN